LDEQDDVGSGVGSADADVAESAGDAEGDAAGFVDLVAADAVVGVGAAVGARGGLGTTRVVAAPLYRVPWCSAISVNPYTRNAQSSVKRRTFDAKAEVGVLDTS
jgi:hypothetical protein